MLWADRQPSVQFCHGLTRQLIIPTSWPFLLLQNGPKTPPCCRVQISWFIVTNFFSVKDWMRSLSIFDWIGAICRVSERQSLSLSSKLKQISFIEQRTQTLPNPEGCLAPDDGDWWRKTSKFRQDLIWINSALCAHCVVLNAFDWSQMPIALNQSSGKILFG